MLDDFYSTVIYPTIRYGWNASFTVSVFFFCLYSYGFLSRSLTFVSFSN